MALTEKIIQEVALGFIKRFYRHRPREPLAITVAGLDVRGRDDIVADGFLQFVTEEGKDFLSTFEATSYEVRDEVYYKPRLDLIRWDGAALAFSSMALLLATLHISQIYLSLEFGWPVLLLTLVAAFLVVFIVAYWGLRLFKRYRYIFAIEQFKQYHADEQWIAVGYDVFSGTNDKYFRELKRQCGRWGVGLVMVYENRQARLLMAPARAAWFGEKRSRIALLPQGQFTDRLKRIPVQQWTALLSQRIRKLFSASNPTRYRWYTKSYPKQLFIATVALLLTVVLLVRELKKWPIVYANAKSYAKRMDRVGDTLRAETDYYLIDAPIARLGDTNFAPYTLPEQEEAFADLMGLPDLGQDEQELPTRIIYTEVGEENIYYADCERFNLIDTTLYLVRDTFVPDLRVAESRLNNYQLVGVNGMAVWSACLRGVSVGYVLFVDDLYVDSIMATVMLDSLQVQFDAAEIPARLRLVGLRPE